MRGLVRKLARALLPAAMIAALACGEFGDMLALQRGLVHQFGMDAVSINVNNGNALTVTFTNSQAATLPDPDRAAFARRVAEFVRDHYTTANTRVLSASMWDSHG